MSDRIITFILYMICVCVGALPITMAIQYFKKKRYYMFATMLLVSIYIVTHLVCFALLNAGVLN